MIEAPLSGISNEAIFLLDLYINGIEPRINSKNFKPKSNPVLRVPADWKLTCATQNLQ